ncbi:proline-rich transmembrane protein 1-like isoform X2 [Hydra vulgaris]|uniref:Proline-rich transmembrane protein 1-like isoform X2 n=1 Tax=Hydra vulgaris TaxID=6087 RepID=A0ABM4C2V1_HYDVU
MEQNYRSEQPPHFQALAQVSPSQSYQSQQYGPSTPLIGNAPYRNPYHAIGIVTQQPEVNMAQLPNSYRATAWFTCLFCCWPLGLMSIKKSNEVETAISLGDIERAQLASKSARNYAIAAVFGGLFVIALLVIYALNL